MLMGLLVAVFLLAHGLIHVAFISPAPPATADGPAWPFVTDRSWLLRALGVQPEMVRILAMALVAATVVGFALAAVAALGVAPGLWMPAIAIGSIASLGTLIGFFHPWLSLGIAIDVVLLCATFVSGWTSGTLAVS
jgi:hypothetical protein